MSLRRHPALQPFSRDHVVGLFHAHQLMWLAEDRAREDLPTTIANFKKAWEQEIATHFNEEEEILSKLKIKEESKAQLLADHNEIRQLAADLFAASAPDLESCKKTGKRLEVHIRWEEHKFFPEIEEALSAEQLNELKEQTQKVDEKRKHGQC